MPRFYIDTDDGRSAVTDEDGTEYQDLASAEDEAMRSLPEMAQSRYPARDWRQVTATVRDEAGTVRFRASMALTVERVRIDRPHVGRAAA